MRLLTAPRIITAATLALVLAGCTSGSHTQPKPEQSGASGSSINLLDGNWAYMPGVTTTHDGLHVSATDFRIVKQDGSGGQPNPPVNEYGTRLDTSGNFRVIARLVDRHGDAALQLYTAAPLIADEFRIEPASIRLTEQDSSLTVQVMDGSSQADVQNSQPALRKTYPIDGNPELAVSKQGDTISVTADDKTIVSLPDGKLFDSGNVLLGLDSANGSFDVPELAAQALGGSKVGMVDTTEAAALRAQTDGLATLAEKSRPDFQVGAAVALAPYTSDEKYAQETAGNFNIVTLENAMKPQFISPKEGVYDFREADALIALAKKNGQLVHGHCIAFSEAEPAWMRNLPTDTAADRLTSGKILLEYARTVAAHFKNDLYSLDAVNEPFDSNDGTTLQHNIWYKALGPDYAAEVFRVVHKAAPNVKLFLNENGAEQAGDRQDAVAQYAIALKEQGVPIYGVGLQSHVYDKSQDIIYPEDVTAMIDKLAAHGLKVRISEMDVPADATYSADDPEAGSGAAYQAWQYEQVTQACYDNPGCIGFTTWGVNNRYDFYQNDNGGLAHGQDLLFNSDNTTTLAYKRLRQLFRSGR